MSEPTRRGFFRLIVGVVAAVAAVPFRSIRLDSGPHAIVIPKRVSGKIKHLLQDHTSQGTWVLNRDVYARIQSMSLTASPTSMTYSSEAEDQEGEGSMYKQFSIATSLATVTKDGDEMSASWGGDQFDVPEEFRKYHLLMGHGSDGKRVTEQMVNDFIVGKIDQKIGLKTTVVVLQLRNGFEVVGTSGCVDPANYDHDRGVELATKRATDEVWKLLGFLLQTARNGVAGPVKAG